MRKARYSVVVLALVATTLLPSVRLTPTLASATILFSNTFDSQNTGALVTGTGANQFTGTSGAARLSVQNTTANSAPNALSVGIAGGGTAYTYEQYGSAYTSHDLQFSVQLGTDFALGSSSDYLVLAQTVPSTSSNAGKVNVTLTQGRHIRLDYFDSAATQHSLYGTSYLVTLGSWHTVELSETVGAGTGSLTLLIDGSPAVNNANLDTGPQGVTRFAVGDEFTPSDAATSGHLYVDDVTTSSTGASPPSTSTPTPTSTPLPASNTPTTTPVPPSSTPTNTAVPPTNTPTTTAVPSATNTAIPPTTTPVPPTSTPTATTGTISGTITDAATGLGIPNALVTTDTGSYTATTNPSGTYTMATVAVGVYTVTASAPGYVSAAQSNVVVTNGAVSSVSLALPPVPTATPTSTPVPPTGTPTGTPVPTPTSTPVLPTANNTPVPTPTPTATPTSSDPVVMAAGDIACDPTDPSYHNGNGIGTSCMQLATSNELTTTVAVLPLGDDQYSSGTLSAFEAAYDPSWGRYKANTYPASGNHEYQTSGAAGYYTYFGSAASPQDSNCTASCKGYYSYNLGAWHLIVLNSECSQVGGCQAGSPQEQWLKADLAAHANLCTLAYWHRPLFTSGTSLGDSAVHDLWMDLYNAHADLVLNGHDHIYERFAPQDPSGAADPSNGITQIIVGTGGKDHGSFSTSAANSVVRDNTTHGVLKLTLHPTSFDWQFLPETAGGNGTFTDSGSQVCH